jgi:putative ABC transport system substrate-binding protein
VGKEQGAEKRRRKLMKQIIIYFALSAMLFAFCFRVQAQQPAKIPRIGYVTGPGSGDASSPSPNFEAFRRGLQDLGYIEGKNIQVEFRYGERNLDRISGIISELVQLKVDVLVIVPSTSIRAAKQATKTIPIVMVTTVDPVAAGLVDSLARPGGNITGLTRLIRDLSGKRLELLKEVVPRISRVGVLWSGTTADAFNDYESAARALKIPLQPLAVPGPKPDLEGAFQAAAKGRVSALVTVTSTLLAGYRKQIADLAIKNRLPSMFEGSDSVAAGGLMSYATSDAENFRRAAVYVDKILKGAKPADLPIEQPTKFEFAINLKTAKALNLTIPQSVLFRADKVIK